MRRRAAVAFLLGAFVPGCSTPAETTLGQAEGCPSFFQYDAGAVGSAGQVIPVVTAASNAWLPGLTLVGLSGRLSPDGTDTDGGWTFTYGNPTGAGLATIRPLATRTLVTGDCDYTSGMPSIRDFKVDSPLALAVAADAGCMLGSIVPVTLLGATDTGSPLVGLAPAWMIVGHDHDGGFVECVVNANTAAFGPPPPDAGAGDAG